MARARSFDRLVILLALVPAAGCNSNRVTTGPGVLYRHHFDCPPRNRPAGLRVRATSAPAVPDRFRCRSCEGGPADPAAGARRRPASSGAPCGGHQAWAWMQHGEPVTGLRPNLGAADRQPATASWRRAPPTAPTAGLLPQASIGADATQGCLIASASPERAPLLALGRRHRAGADRNRAAGNDRCHHRLRHRPRTRHHRPHPRGDGAGNSAIRSVETRCQRLAGKRARTSVAAPTTSTNRSGERPVNRVKPANSNAVRNSEAPDAPKAMLAYSATF